MSCDLCPFKGSTQVPPSGNLNAKYVLVGEAPGHYEVQKGEPFVGPTGRLLDAFLPRAGIDRADCYLTNALLCPVSNKKDTPQAVACCRERLMAELEQTTGTIVLMGKNARDALYPNEQGGIMASRGWREVDGRQIFVMAHPSFFLYNPNEGPLLLKDLRRVARGKLPPIGPFEIARSVVVPIPVFTEIAGAIHLTPSPPKFKAQKMWKVGDELVIKSPHRPYVAYLLNSLELLRTFVTMLRDKSLTFGKYAAFDLETDQVDYMRDRILCMSVSLKEGVAHIIPDSVLYEDGATFVTTGRRKQWWEAFLGDFRYHTGAYLKPRAEAVELLSEMFAIEGFTWVGHNMKFDLRFLVGQLGVRAPVSIYDTIVAHYTLDERKAGHALKPLADDYFDTGNYEADLFNYIAKKSGRYSAIPRDVLYKYNAMDTEVTLRLAYTFEAKLRAQGIFEQPFRFPMMAAVPMLLDAELKGMAIDWDEFERIDEEEIEPRLLRTRDEMREICGHLELNPLSSQKINNILYDELGFPIIEVRTRAAGKRIKERSSQKAVMDGWRKMREVGTLHVSEQAWAFVEKLAEYRHLRKLRGSYVRKWVKHQGTDSRVHTSFQLRGTVTGRLSSKDPPMQTIPSKVKEPIAVMVANAHVSQPGWSLLYADYSQAELMVAACLSGDEFMINAFREGATYHSEVAQAAFGDDFTRDERQACKRLTFGWLFGGNAYEIAMNALQFEGAVAKRFAEEWDQRFKGVVAWRKAQAALMLKQGYVESLFGRRRRQMLLSKENVGKAQRIAMNAPIQSAVSDLNLISAIEMHNRYKDSGYAHVVLLIHDSIVMEVRDDKISEVEELLGKTMLDVAGRYFPQVPFHADVKYSKQLGDLT